MAKAKLEGRIRYEENFMNDGEHFIFEIKWTNEDEWRLETAYRCVDDKISYQALTHIRKWQNLDIKFHFA